MVSVIYSGYLTTVLEALYIMRYTNGRILVYVMCQKYKSVG